MKCVQLRAFEILLDLSHLSLNLSLDLEVSNLSLPIALACVHVLHTHIYV